MLNGIVLFQGGHILVTNVQLEILGQSLKHFLKHNCYAKRGSKME